jgi:chromosome segregation ATPase
MAEGFPDDNEAMPVVASPQIRMKMLVQMAEALEDEAASFSRRDDGLREEEFLLTREIDERQTDINRLQLKLEGLRCERQGLVQRIESLRCEAAAMKEEAFNNEEEIALSLIDDVPTDDDRETSPDGPVFFQRMSLKQETVSR